MKEIKAPEAHEIRKFVNATIFKTIIGNIFVLILFFVPIKDYNAFEFIAEMINDSLNLADDGIYALFRILHILTTFFAIIFSTLRIVLAKNKYVANPDEDPRDWACCKIFMSNFFIPLAPILIFMALVALSKNSISSVMILFGIFMLYIIFYCFSFYKTSKCVLEPVALYSQDIMEKNKTERQEKKTTKKAPAFQAKQESYKDKASNADALLKYKQLYDAGAITEEEYNAKKEELLK